MAYQNNNNSNSTNGFQQIHVNTNGVSMYSGDDRIQVNLYDQNISLAITHAVQINGSRRFPKENAVSVIFTPDRAEAFATILCDGVIEAIRGGKTYQRSLPMNRDASAIAKIEVDANSNVIMYIYTGIGADRIPKTVARYQFDDVTPLQNYDPTNGTYDVGEPIRAQLGIFAKAFNAFTENASMASAHFAKMDNRWSNKHIMDDLYAIATKLGVPMSQNTYQPAGHSNVPTGNSYNYNRGNSQQPAVQNVSSIDAMMSVNDDNPFPVS